MSGVLRLVRSYSPERRRSLWTPSAEPSRPRPRGAPAPSVLLRPLSPCSSSSSLLSLVLFPVVALLPVVFIPSRRNERLPRRDARGPCPGRDAIPGQRAPRLGASVPQGWLRFLGGGGSFPGVTGGPCAGSGSRPPAGVVVGNRPLAGALWRDRRSAPQRGLVANSVRTCVAAGVLGLFARASLSILSSAAPLSVVRALPAPIPGGALGPKAEGGGSSVPAGTAKGSGSRTASHGSLQRRRPRRTEAIQPPPPHRRKVSHRSVQDARYPGPGRSLFLNRPVAGRRCRAGAFGAVAGTTDAKACVRGAGGGVFAFSRPSPGPAVYLYSLLPASPSRGSSVSRADSERRGRPEVMDGIDAGAPDDRGCRSLHYRTGGGGLWSARFTATP